MRITLASAYRTELRHLAEQVTSAKRHVLESLMSSTTTSRGSSTASVSAAKNLSRTEDASLLSVQLLTGDAGQSLSRDEVQKRWHDAQLEHARSHMS